MVKTFFEILLKSTEEFFTFDNIKTILIFITGIKTLWDLYKEFLIKPKIKLEIEKSSLVKKDKNKLDFQINLSLSSLNDADAYLTKVFLFNEKEVVLERLSYGRPASKTKSSQAEVEIFSVDIEPTREIEIDWAIEYLREDFPKLNLDDLNYQAAIVSIRSTSFFPIRDFKLVKGSRKSFTLLGRMYLNQTLDDSQEKIVPTTGWSLCIDYGVATITEKVFVA